MGKMTAKKGQLTLTFNWVFVMIAGGMILLFFVAIVVKQKSVSENKLNMDIVTVMDSILTGSTVSEQTINFIDTSGLAGFELYFDCQLDDGGGYSDIFSRYGITDSSAVSELPVQVLFAPRTMEGSEMITWSLPYKMPYKVMDMLMVSSTSIKYYVIGGEGSDFRTQFENVSSGFTIDFISSTSEISEIGGLYHVRIIDLDGDNIVSGGAIPSALLEAGNTEVTAVVLGQTLGQVDYYQKSGSSWSRLTTAGSVPIITTGTEIRDPTVYGALFSSDDEAYKCNMLKAFKRLKILTEMYLVKTQNLIEYYSSGEGAANSDCILHLSENTGNNLEDTLENLNGELSTCVEFGYDDCTDITSYAIKIAELNDNLDSYNCATLY